MRATAIGVALLLDALLGDPRRNHPVAGFGRVAARLERLLWRDERRAGALHVAALVAGAAGTAAGVRLLERATLPAGETAFAAVALWATLGGQSLRQHALALAAAVDEEDLALARSLAPTLVGRDPEGLDAGELCRAAVESVAENTTDAVVAPICWFALLGPTGAAAYRAVNTLDAMVGHHSPRYERFGWAAARLDDLAA